MEGNTTALELIGCLPTTFNEAVIRYATTPKIKENALKIGELLNGLSAGEIQEVLGLVHNNFALNCVFTFDGEED